MSRTINREIAEGMHSNFMQTLSPGPGEVKAVFFPFSDFAEAINEAYKQKGIDLTIDLPGLGFYCYFARYIDQNPTLEKNTIIIAFADQDLQDPTKLFLLNGNIYDFGEPCPKKCPTNNFP